MISPELLRRHPFFSPFNDRQLKALAMISEGENVEAGQTIIKEGHPADFLLRQIASAALQRLNAIRVQLAAAWA